jgi:hypothetical protein
MMMIVVDKIMRLLLGDDDGCGRWSNEVLTIKVMVVMIE